MNTRPYIPLNLLYGKLPRLLPGVASSRAIVVPGTTPPAPPIDSSILFFWDEKAGQLINPYNLAVDPALEKTQDYKFVAALYNFHASQASLQGPLAGATNNAQLTFSAQAADSTGELFQWMMIAGIAVAAPYLSGADSQSINTAGAGAQANNLTNFGAPADQIVIMNGTVTLTLGVAAQKPGSFWDELVSLFGRVSNSPVFGMLPLPRLTSEAAQALSALLGQVEKNESLVPIIQGKPVDFRLWDGATAGNLFALRSGFWVVFNYEEIRPYIDPADRMNVKKGVGLDILEMQYDVRDAANKPLDITYAAIKINLAPVSKR